MSHTPEQALEIWKATDPRCSKWEWYNVLWWFVRSRAEKFNLVRAIRDPELKDCLACGQRFSEESVRWPFVKRLGIDHLDFCDSCLEAALAPNYGWVTASRQQILDYLKDLANLLHRVPPQDFGEREEDLDGLDWDEKKAFLMVLTRKPSANRVEKLFGTRLAALVEAGILEDGALETSRGIQCLANDGHMCFSLGEKTIDDFLDSFGIRHKREPHYPEGRFRADFEVKGVFIEYLGLAGDPDYDAKTRKKQEICKKHGISLICVYPQDLANVERLKTKLRKGLQAVLPGELFPSVSPHTLLEQAITAIRADDRVKGRQLLAQEIIGNPRNEQAWFWLASVVDRPDQRLECYRRVLALNPNNVAARKAIEM